MAASNGGSIEKRCPSTQPKYPAPIRSAFTITDFPERGGQMTKTGDSSGKLRNRLMSRGKPGKVGLLAGWSFFPAAEFVCASPGQARYSLVHCRMTSRALLRCADISAPSNDLCAL